MKRIGVSVVLSILLFFGFALEAMGQDDPFAGSVAPILVNIQQTIPVTVTLSIPVDGITQTVNVPMNLSLDLQLSIADTISATVQIAPDTEDARVTVSEAAAAIPVPRLPTPVPTAASDGNGVIGNVRWAILSAEDMGNRISNDSMFGGTATTTGKFIRIVVEVENVGDEQLNINGFNLIDGQGRSFSPSTQMEALMVIGQDKMCFYEALNPSLTKECTFLYEVPANVTALQAEITNLDMFDEETALLPLDIVSRGD